MELLGSVRYYFLSKSEILQPLFPQIFFFFFCLLHSFSPSPSGIPVIYVLDHFKLTHSLLMLWFGEVSFLVVSLSSFCIGGDGGFIECPLECSLLFNILEEFEKDQYKFSFVYLVEFTCEAI